MLEIPRTNAKSSQAREDGKERGDNKQDLTSSELAGFLDGGRDHRVVGTGWVGLAGLFAGQKLVS